MSRAAQVQAGRRLRLAVLACACVAATRATAAPRVRCTARAAAERALVEVVVLDLTDADLLELVRLGLEGRVQVSLTLRRPRPLWFDERVTHRTVEATLLWRAGRFLMDGQPLADPARLPMPLVALAGGQAAADGRHVVDVRATLEVVTSGSLGKMARWMVGGGEGASRSALSRALLETVAADLAREASASCPVSPGRAAPRGP